MSKPVPPNVFGHTFADDFSQIEVKVVLATAHQSNEGRARLLAILILAAGRFTFGTAESHFRKPLDNHHPMFCWPRNPLLKFRLSRRSRPRTSQRIVRHRLGFGYRRQNGPGTNVEARSRNRSSSQIIVGTGAVIEFRIGKCGEMREIH